MPATDPLIRRIRPDETEAWLEAMSTAFFERMDKPRLADELRTVWDYDRAWAAVEGDRFVGTFRSWATELTVPGGARVPAAAVSGVTVRPDHRRRGILGRLVAAEHAAARE